MAEDWRRASVEQWGYTCSLGQNVGQMVWPVRFKPAVTLAVVILALLLHRPWLLAIAGALGLVGTFLQKFSWIDILYNQFARHVFGGPALGPDPSMRRWLCGTADLFLLLAGLSYMAHRPIWGIGLAGVVVLLAGSVVATGICLPAYLAYAWTKTARPSPGSTPPPLP